ncbi:MAG: L-lactate dehydrogenase [Bacilli bacterium]|nr:L-lactate dehydrogenase [Bacilli bacterium]
MINRKIAIIGDGAVGSSIAFALTLSDLVSEIVIIDINKAKVEGDVLDLNHSMSLTHPKKIIAGEYKDIENAKVIVLACGVGQREGETRIQLLERNKRVFDSVIDSMKPYIHKEAIVLVVSNPVDILSYYTSTKLNLPKSQVFGSGTVLDTARLKYLLSADTGIDPRNIHAYVIGEHGDSEIAAFSVTSIAGLSIEKFCEGCKRCKGFKERGFAAMQDDVRHAAYEIIQKKGATYYGIAASTKRIIQAILNNEHSVLTISTYLENEFNGKVNDVYLSLPVVVGSMGVERIIRPEYSKEEVEGLVKSAEILKQNR